MYVPFLSAPGKWTLGALSFLLLAGCASTEAVAPAPIQAAITTPAPDPRLSALEARLEAGQRNALASAHFALEEKIMAELEWPRLRERCDLHARLLGQVRDIIDAYETGFYLSREGLPGSLGKWLSEAIDADVKMFAELGDPTLRA